MTELGYEPGSKGNKTQVLQPSHVYSLRVLTKGEDDFLSVLGLQTHSTELDVTNNRVQSTFWVRTRLGRATNEASVESGCPTCTGREAMQTRAEPSSPFKGKASCRGCGHRPSEAEGSTTCIRKGVFPWEVHLLFHYTTKESNCTAISLCGLTAF